MNATGGGATVTWQAVLANEAPLRQEYAAATVAQGQQLSMEV